MLCSLCIFTHASAGDIFVGTDSVCDFDNIQDAINSVSGSAPVKIKVTAQQVWSENLIISNKHNLTIEGQYIDCRHDLGVNPTVIDNGASAASSVNIFDSTNIRIENIHIRNSTFRGGMLINQSSVALLHMGFIDNKRNGVFTGEFAAGGGLSAINNADVTLFESFFTGNKARNGGGIACHNSVLTITNSTITNNQTTDTNDDPFYGKGGGIFASNQCLIEMNSIQFFQDSTALQVNDNTASYSGGGLYADEASTVNINHFESNFEPMQMFIRNNQINYSGMQINNNGGAGLMATGVGTSVDAYHLVFDGNTIDQATNGAGAALLINSQAIFSMRVRQSQNDCGLNLGSLDKRCNQIINNKALAPFFGTAGMLGVGFAAQAEIYQTYIANNAASQAQLGFIIDLGTLNMQGNTIVNNGIFSSLVDSELFIIANSANLRVDFSTFTDNYLFSGEIFRSFDSNLVAITRTIIDENLNVDVYHEEDLNNPSTTFFRCLLSHENTSISGDNIVVNSPVYQSLNPYHLTANSPGIDMCEHSLGDLAVQADIDSEQRGVCIGNCTDFRFDVGADEYHDQIFKDGIE